MSLRGTLHIFIAIPMGIAIRIAIFLFSRAFDELGRWRRFAMYSKLTAITGLVLAAINHFIAEYNQTEAKPFMWRADPDEIIAARNRGFQILDSIH